MGSFGENLRREREMRGVTLEEISAATKISVRFLKAIENEEFSRLPGGIFTRSFVRAYARYLGLEEDPLLEEYQLAAKASGEVDLSQFSPARPYPARRERRFHPALWAALISAILLATGFVFWRHAHRPGKVPSQAMELAPIAKGSLGELPSGSSAASATLTSKPGSETKSAVTSVGVNTGAGKTKPAGQGVLAATSAAARSVPQIPPITDYDGKLVLQIATTERSWVAIDADGKTVLQGIMEPNEVKTFRADASYDVLTGNAQGVILSLNGHTLKPLGREGEVKQVHLTWNSLKEQSSH